VSVGKLVTVSLLTAQRKYWLTYLVLFVQIRHSAPQASAVFWVFYLVAPSRDLARLRKLKAGKLISANLQVLLLFWQKTE